VPRVYPSQIVDLLDQISPDRLLSSELSAVIDLLSELPSELLAISGNDYSKYRISIQEINGLVDAWKNGRGDQHRVHQCANSLEVIRDLLSKCPDESPSPSTACSSLIPLFGRAFATTSAQPEMRCMMGCGRLQRCSQARLQKPCCVGPLLSANPRQKSRPHVSPSSRLRAQRTPTNGT